MVVHRWRDGNETVDLPLQIEFREFRATNSRQVAGRVGQWTVGVLTPDNEAGLPFLVVRSQRGLIRTAQLAHWIEPCEAAMSVLKGGGGLGHSADNGNRRRSTGAAC